MGAVLFIAAFGLLPSVQPSAPAAKALMEEEAEVTRAKSSSLSLAAAAAQVANRMRNQTFSAAVPSTVAEKGSRCLFLLFSQRPIFVIFFFFSGICSL